jgi:hypothetical protein
MFSIKRRAGAVEIMKVAPEERLVVDGKRGGVKCGKSRIFDRYILWHVNNFYD